ncbi:DUF4238 domain-containing protein [Priestia megaterium]|uniref:DUF4238 domain-containing protein n=1 Tax=Priestia megaterium TaxID=1404 RepID=UPI0035B5BB5C
MSNVTDSNYGKYGKKIFVYDNKINKIKERNIKTVSIVEDFYTIHQDETNKKMYDLELSFARYFEPAYNPFIEIVEKDFIIKDIHKEYFSYFIAAQYLRTPKMKKQILKEIKVGYSTGVSGEVFDYSDMLSFRKNYCFNNKEITYEEFLEMKNHNTIIVDLEEDIYVKYIVKKIKPLANEFKNKDWLVLKAPRESSFISSDNPIFSVDNYKEMKLTALQGKLFILTKQLAILIGGNYEGYYDIQLDDLETINYCVSKNSDRIIFSHDKDLLSKNIKVKI